MKTCERPGKYTLPFVDTGWKVAFIVLDFLGGRPLLLEGPVRLDGARLQTSHSQDSLKPIEEVPLARFRDLAHFDPWWVFRGVSGVERPWIEAIAASNIARPFVRENLTFKLEDLEFTPNLERLLAAIAKDEGFHRVAFGPGDLDLRSLRRPSSRGRDAASERGAKPL